eukprot:g3530.t1
MTWMPVVRNIMELYQQRTMGSRIEQKTSSLVWDHSNADADFAAIQASNMIVQMKPILRNFAVDILEGKGYVEVRQRGVNKGAAALRILEILNSTGPPVDFVLSMGDDSSDETMFRALLSQNGPGSERHRFLCTVGKKPSNAEFYVQDVDDVETLVNMLMRQSVKAKASQSMADLRKLRSFGMVRVDQSTFAVSPGGSPSSKRKRPAAMSRVASMPTFTPKKSTRFSSESVPDSINDFLEDIEEDGEDSENDEGGLWM